MPRLDEPPGEIFAKHDHAPPHLFRAGATYFITGKMLYGQVASDRVIVEAVASIAAARGVSRAQVALAWLLRNPVVSAPIVGARSPHISTTHSRRLTSTCPTATWLSSRRGTPHTPSLRAV